MGVRQLAKRGVNERLQAVMHEAGCSNTGLARRVNVCGAEQGLNLRYDKTSVSRWLRGQQPRGRTPAVIAQALGRKLGRVVTVDEIGLAPEPGTAPTAGLRYEPVLEVALREARDLWRADAVHTVASAGEGLPTSVLVQPSRDWLITDPDPTVVSPGPFAVRTADITVARATAAAFADLDHRFGSGTIRPSVVHYLDDVVSGLLVGSRDDVIGRQLLGIAARLTELAGYMAVDTGQPGLAQRYYIQALRLSHAADDHSIGAYVLASGMSRGALLLGSPREAVQLARVARQGARSRGARTAEAVCHAAEARGHALLGDADASDRAVENAVEALAQAGPDEKPEWGAHVDRSYLAEEQARCLQDLDRPAPAAQWALEALRGCPAGRARRRALRLLLVASTQLRLGEVAPSCETAEQAAEIIGSLHSTQCSEGLKEFCGRLEASGHRDEALALL
ncbi:hypothetical protein LZG04_39245 [Saccharothrix sp. S26]|uniref:hypothetical protein n=1 Tax=Saccharothrix sp. S26 TaxID=2907215 RepID=UPI001F37136C|nr:hypothetical protein [Saccharothrix sp. S26]MCE7000811.1 hypothetical protein [Saccharothrix sp. S26]